MSTKLIDRDHRSNIHQLAAWRLCLIEETMINLAAVGLQSVDQKKGELVQRLYEGCIIKCLEVRPARPTPRMITEGIASVIGRDDLPDFTRDEVETIYMAMIAVAHKEFNERPE